SNFVSNTVLEQHVFERLRPVKPEVVNIEYRLDPLSYLGINTNVVDKNTRIDKVRLPLNLTAPQAGQNAVWLYQSQSCLRESYPISIPERKLTADKVWIIENCVEPCTFTVGRILITLRPEKRPFESEVIAVHRRLDRSHL